MRDIFAERYIVVYVPPNREALLAELEAIQLWDRKLILQDQISPLDKLSYDLRQERKAEREM